MSRNRLLIPLLLSLTIPMGAQAQDGANGIGDGSELAGAFLGPIDTQVNGPWLEFQFGAAGTEVLPCTTCVPSSGGNSVFLVDPPPWTFSLPFGGGTLKATDAFLYGDQFDVYDFGAIIGSTSVVAPDGNCGSDPEFCFPDPLSSSGSFPLAAGDHEITLFVTVSPFNSGAAYFRVDQAAVEVDIDIKFCSNPNAFNSKQRGGLPVTIFGNGVAVVDIDLDTLKLCTDAFGANCTPPGVKSFSIADRGDPTTDLGADACAIDPDTGEELDYLNPDGNDDLDAVFFAQEVAALISPVSRGDVVGPLYVVGYLNDSTPFTSVPVFSEGVDLLVIRK